VTRLGLRAPTSRRTPKIAGWRNSGDDLAIGTPARHPRPTNTNAMTSTYVLKRRPRSQPDVTDTEEVTGSIPVSPTSKTAGQIARYRILVTGYSRVARYVGSKLGAQDHPQVGC
jgi:hypothetical protein